MNETFDTTTITEVFENSRTEVVNEYHKLGWKIINTHTYAAGDGISGEATVYSLGWTRDLGKPKHPKGESQTEGKWS